MRWLALLALLPSVAFAQLSGSLSSSKADTDYVNVTGDTMTGNLQAVIITATSVIRSQLEIANPTATNGCTSSGAAAPGVCIDDILTVDGIIYIEETTTPTAEANYGALYTKTDNKLYFQTGAGVEEEVVVTGAGAFTAMAYDEENTDAFVVTVDNEWESYHTNGIASGNLSGWTLDTGGAGTSHAITSIADAGGGDITVTTGTSHNLAVGDIISQSNATDAAYEGVFVVLTVPTATTYTVTAVYTATDTGTMNQAATLIAGTGAAGDYHVTWGASATSAVNNETFDYGIFLNGDGASAAPTSGSEIRRKYGTATDFGDFGRGFLVTIADGDKLSLGLKNITGNGNVTVRYLTIALHRL
jgi:hypothetical protein